MCVFLFVTKWGIGFFVVDGFVGMGLFIGALIERGKNAKLRVVFSRRFAVNTATVDLKNPATGDLGS